MLGQAAVVTLRAYGYDVRSDGLGNVQARVWERHNDETQTSHWVPVPTECTGQLKWLADAMAHNLVSSPAL